MSLVDAYAKEIRKQLRFHAVWPPQMPIRLGDYGKLTNGVFERTGTLVSTIKLREGAQPLPFKYSSTGTVEVSLSGQVEAAAGGAPLVSGTLRISFKAENSFLVRLAGYRIETIKNLDDIEREVKAMADARKWSADLLVVTTRHIAKRCTVLVASAAGASVDLGVEGEGALADLTNPSLHLTLRSNRDMGFSIVDAPEVTPFCSLMELRGWFDPELAPKHLAPGVDLLPEGSAEEPRLALVLDE
ncbi:hypothetical protein [Sorangium sp. So ce1182]|uniref:hypothetical protein n=1 Tax=Sorangium sp. So ce1182 TaxID=3133334 RepID=UPI003F5D7F7D